MGNEETIYYGIKQNKMKISKEVYDALVEWRNDYGLYASSGRHSGYINGNNLFDLPEVVQKWRVDIKAPISTNNRLIAIIRWVNGEDVFEVEKPKKWVVRSKENDEYGDYRYIYLADYAGITNIKFVVENGNATKFDTKEEAESWANAHQEVVEVEA